jgi:hypothetical protein
VWRLRAAQLPEYQETAKKGQLFYDCLLELLFIFAHAHQCFPELRRTDNETEE